MSTNKLNLSINQGATFDKTVFWYGGGKVCNLIEDLTPGCPTLITITDHGLVSISDTPVFISHVKGATRANTEANAPVIATYIDADSFYVDVETVAQTYEANTGLVTYYAPKNITGWDARMHIRAEIDSTSTILELVSPTDITVNGTDGSINLYIEDTVTAALDFDEGVYDLELEDAAGDTTRLVEGKITLHKEVTRE
jgi:hypothetical protein